MGNLQLPDDEEVISFDVSSLYTNVPVQEAIEHCADLLFSSTYKKPPVTKETFSMLALLSNCNLLMLTHNGYYRQVDGLAMDSPSALSFANGWLSKFDDDIKDDAQLYSRYMDDIIHNIKSKQIESKLDKINNVHPNLKFTVEPENNNSIPFLDMKITRSHGKLSSIQNPLILD